MTRNARSIFGFWILWGIFAGSLLLMIGCQTLNQDSSTKEMDILQSQKEIVLNYLNSGEPVKALGELRELLRVNPKDADLYNLMGLTQIALKNAKRGLEYLKQAYKLKPAIYISLNLSSAHIDMGEYDKAEKILLSLLKTSEFSEYQNRERVYHNLGLINEKKGVLEKAEYYYKKGLEENPVFYISLLQLGVVYKKMGRSANARDYLDRAKDACRSCFEPIEALSIQLAKEGRWNEAMTLVKSFMATDGLDTRIYTTADNHLKILSSLQQKRKSSKSQR